MNHIPHQDRFQSSTGMLITPDGERRPVQINLYWSNHNPLAYVIGIRDVDANEQQAWEVARWLFLAADSRSVNGALVGGGDFAVGYPTQKTTVLFFKPAHEPREKWAQVALPAHEVRAFVDATFKGLHGYSEQDVIDRQVQVAIDWCLADVSE